MPQQCRELIAEATAVYVSSVVLWEIAIKSAAGKLIVDADALDTVLVRQGYRERPVTWAHAHTLVKLPGHHRDPFDRKLVAQAITEPLRLLTSDRTLAQYSPLVQVV